MCGKSCNARETHDWDICGMAMFETRYRTTVAVREVHCEDINDMVYACHEVYKGEDGQCQTKRNIEKHDQASLYQSSAIH